MSNSLESRCNGLRLVASGPDVGNTVGNDDQSPATGLTRAVMATQAAALRVENEGEGQGTPAIDVEMVATPSLEPQSVYPIENFLDSPEDFKAVWATL